MALSDTEKKIVEAIGGRLPDIMDFVGEATGVKELKTAASATRAVSESDLISQLIEWWSKQSKTEIQYAEGGMDVEDARPDLGPLVTPED